MNFENESELKNENIQIDETAAKKEKKRKLKAEIIDWVKTIFFYCVIPVAIFECFFFVANVPTGSMETTVPTGSQVITTRCFNKDNVERGDVVVFYSEELDMVLLKRCIGLPGDTVEFDGEGNTYINGEYYDESYVSSYSDFEGSFEVPEGCYFFCGDNRRSSFDARFWDDPYIEKENVKGIARFIVFPFGSFGLVD